jgi:hypothetical protein
MTSDTVSSSKGMVWAGRVIFVLLILFFLFDSIPKILKMPFVIKPTLDLGYPESTIVGIRLALFVSLVLYMIPRTAVLGAILITGYLGGATATQVRVGAIIPFILMPAVMGVLVWFSLWLRDSRIRALMPLVRE